MRLTFMSLMLLIVSAKGFAEDFPTFLVRFRQYGTKPVFTGAGEGTWDAKIRERGSIDFDRSASETDPNRFRLWYTGYDGTREGIKRVGLATSVDGISWSRHKNNPIVNDEWVEDMNVLPPRHENKEWLMFAEGRNDLAQVLTSSDGIAWRRTGQLDVRKVNGQPIEAGPYGTPTVVWDGNLWNLFYERSDLGVWLATSTDRKVWTNVSDDPVLRPGQGLHDRDLIAMNQVVRYSFEDGSYHYYAYYHGSAKGETPALWSTCVAVSDDLRSWRKYPQNPLLPRQLNRSSGILVGADSKMRLYTMHPDVWLHISE